MKGNHHLFSRVRNQLLSNKIEGMAVEAWIKVATAKTKDFVNCGNKESSQSTKANFAKIPFFYGGGDHTQRAWI